MEAVFVQKPFVSHISKDTDAQFKAKITRHGKTKHVKDETGNVLLKLKYFLPVYNLAQKGEQSGQVMSKNKINMMSRNDTKRKLAYVEDLIID